MAVRPGFEVRPLPSAHPTPLRMDNCSRADGGGSNREKRLEKAGEARVRETKKVLSADIGQGIVAMDNQQFSSREVSSIPKTYETSHKHGKRVCRCM